MKYCTSCGTELDKNSLFCPNCGSDMKNAGSSMKNRPQPTTPPVHQRVDEVALARAQKGGNGPFKWIAIAVMSFIVLAAGAIFALSTMFNPAKALDEVNEQFLLENQLEFYNSFNIPSGTIGGKEEFYSAMKTWDEIYPKLQAAIETDDLPFEITDANGERILLATVTKEFGVFKKLQLTYAPKDLTLAVANKQTSVKVDDQEFLTVADGESFTVPFIPGKYKLTVTSGENTREEIVYVEQQKENKFTVAPFEAAPKETAKAEAPAQQTTQVVVPKVEKKPALTMDSYSNIDGIYSFFDSYRSDYEAALYYIAPTYIQSYFSNNSLYREFEKFIDGHYSIPGYEYTFGTNEITKMEPVDTNSFNVFTYETFHFYSNEDGMYYYERTKRYTIAHNGGNFKITAIKTLNTDKYKQ